MTTVLDFLHSVLGTNNPSADFFFYILGGSIILIFIDAILTFIFGGLSSLTRK